MKKTFFVLILSIVSLAVSAQFVASREVKENIPGLCNKKEVYVLFPIDGQVEAVCPLTKQELLNKLNKDVTFITNNPKYKDHGMIEVIINCKGEVVWCQMDGNGKTKSPELDKQIEGVFNSLGLWKVGTLDDQKVDSSRLFSFKIVKGVFEWE